MIFRKPYTVLCGDRTSISACKASACLLNYLSDPLFGLTFEGFSERWHLLGELKALPLLLLFPRLVPVRRREVPRLARPWAMSLGTCAHQLRGCSPSKLEMLVCLTPHEIGGSVFMGFNYLELSPGCCPKVFRESIPWGSCSQLIWPSKPHFVAFCCLRT